MINTPVEILAGYPGSNLPIGVYKMPIKNDEAAEEFTDGLAATGLLIFLGVLLMLLSSRIFL